MRAEYTDTTFELRRDPSIRDVELDDSRGDGQIERLVGIRGSVGAEIRKKGVSTMKRNVVRWERDETICVRTSVLEPIVTIPIRIPWFEIRETSETRKILCLEIKGKSVHDDSTSNVRTIHENRFAVTLKRNGTTDDVGKVT